MTGSKNRKRADLAAPESLGDVLIERGHGLGEQRPTPMVPAEEG